MSFRPTARLLALSLLSAAPFTNPAHAQATTDDTALPQVNVVADRATGQYNPQHSSGATRTDTPLREVPQSVRVMSQQQIEDLGALRRCCAAGCTGRWRGRRRR